MPHSHISLTISPPSQPTFVPIVLTPLSNVGHSCHTFVAEFLCVWWQPTAVFLVLPVSTLLFNFMISLFHCVVHTGLARSSLLPQSPECWNHSCPSPCTTRSDSEPVSSTVCARPFPCAHRHLVALHSPQPCRALLGPQLARSFWASGPLHVLGWRSGPCALSLYALPGGLATCLPPFL